MLLDSFQFSNSQTLSGLNSTGVVSTETWDLEEIHDSTMTDDQVIGGVIVTILSCPAQATIVATEGVEFQVRTAAAEALASLYEIVGSISVLPSKIVAGAQFFIPIYCDVAQKELGLWYKAVSTSVTGNIVVDADYSDVPACKNESLQKVPT